jgi:hypothetical protein
MNKICVRCNKEKPYKDFYINKNNKDGLTGYCRLCYREYRQSRRDIINEIKRKEYHRNKNTYKNFLLKSKFGITLIQYESLVKKQNNKCAICGKEETKKQNGKIKYLAVDHNHTTNKIRALLCSNCNLGLGNFFEDKTLLKLAIKYLEKYEP